jgi:hypothetical protein
VTIGSPTLSEILSRSVEVSSRIALPAFAKVLAGSVIAVCPSWGKEQEKSQHHFSYLHANPSSFLEEVATDQDLGSLWIPAS